MDSVNPEILQYISRFENQNNLTKRLDIEEINPADLDYKKEVGVKKSKRQ